MSGASGNDCPHLECVGEITKEELIQKSHVSPHQDPVTTFIISLLPSISYSSIVLCIIKKGIIPFLEFAKLPQALIMCGFLTNKSLGNKHCMLLKSVKWSQCAIIHYCCLKASEAAASLIACWRKQIVLFNGILIFSSFSTPLMFQSCELQRILCTTVKKFEVRKIFLLLFLKEVSYVHQGCVYFIKIQ